MPRQTRSQSRTPPTSSSSSSSGRDHAVEESGGPLQQQAKDDKENCVKKSDFQPPSPLTSSKRHKTKGASSKAKKILSPNRNNQWSQRERLRSSPIEHASSSYHHQDRDSSREAQASRGRSSSSNNLKREMYNTMGGGELDLMKSDDDFGPSIEDCLNLGSFAEDSPPRDNNNKASIYRRPPDLRASPPTYPYNNYGSRAPPDYSRHAPHMYYGAPPPPYSGYPPADYPPWQSPRPYNDAYGRGAHKPPYEGASPPSKKSRRWDGLQTPEKSSSKNARSPFRSPLPDSAKKFKRSPIWGGGPGTPNIGMYGSFGMMDTPGATQLDGFSPMGPAFASFENDSPPLPMEGEVLDDRLSLVVGDDAMRAPPSIRQRESSYNSSFIDEMAHMPGTIQGSPVRPSRYYSSSEKDRRHPPVKRPPPGTVTKRHIFASPLATSHGGSSSRRAPWYDHASSRQPPPTPGPMRMELSDMGSRASETRRSLEGINTMLRGGVGAPPPPRTLAHPGAPHPGAPPGYDRQYRDISTPVKIGGPPPRMPLSQSRGPAYPGPAPMSGRKAPPMSSSVSRYPQPSPQVRPPSSAQRVHSSASKITPSAAAAEKMTPAAKRNPCNCKKTKCLKLYCECFAAELYCDGCNCSDCHNSKAHEDVRSKAMKDTRAKNPNAFKPRIAVTAAGQAATPSSAHSMGCKCKRSECLKKYCECFQAGVMCGNKCKCVDCLNYVGSQALIDKLRKIKDHRGADFAMRLADEAWKGKHGRPSSTTPATRRLPSPAPSRATQHHMPPQHMMPPGPYMGYPYPSPMGGGHAAPQFARSDSRSTASRPSSRSENKKAPSARDPIRPSSKELLAKATAQRPRASPPPPAESNKPPAVTPATTTTTTAVNTESPSSTPAPSIPVNEQPAAPIKATVPIKMEPDVEMTDQVVKTAAPTPAPKAAAATPRTPGVRLGYDPYSSKKKRRLRPGEKEASFAYFGDCPQQPKTTALAVFSFLTNQEICKARLVSKQWSGLGMDEELWQF